MGLLFRGPHLGVGGRWTCKYEAVLAQEEMSKPVERRLRFRSFTNLPGGLALWTFQSNTRAQEFYRRHGFTEVRRTDGSANEERVPDVRMVWGSHPERLESAE